MNEADKKDNDKKPVAQLASYAIYGAVGIQLAAAVIAGLFFGNYVDKKLGTLPWLTITGLALGFIGGLVNLVRILGWFSKNRPY